ncbi:hypothetical protein GW17_00056539, partial [Ensete ventricosum]
NTTYCLLRSLVEHSCINPKSLTFGYLDEKLVDTDLIKFIGLYHFALSWYLEFASAFSTSSAHFMTNLTSPSVVHSPHILMNKAFIRYKIRCTHTEDLPLRYHGIPSLNS